jgi:hypothetical protein
VARSAVLVKPTIIKVVARRHDPPTDCAAPDGIEVSYPGRALMVWYRAETK